MTTLTEELYRVLSYIERQQLILAEVGKEWDRARAKFPCPLHSAHEALAVIREEYLETEREVFARSLNHDALREELLQLAAMAVRSIEDLGLMEDREKGQVA